MFTHTGVSILSNVFQPAYPCTENIIRIALNYPHTFLSSTHRV